MEIVGSVSAILATAEAFAHLCKRLHRYYRRLKYARDDVKDIRDEVESFSDLLCSFHRTVTDERLANQGLSTKIKTSNLPQNIVNSGRRALGRIDRILKGLDPLRTDKVYPTIEQWIARWKWFTRKEQWSPIHILLNSIKQSANLFISIACCQDLLQKLDQLRAERITIPHEMHQELSLYARQAKTMMSRCKRAERECSRMQAQQADMLRMAQEIVALSATLARSHLASHPELEAVIGRNGAAPFVNSTTPGGSGSSGRSATRHSHLHSPRDPPSGPSSGHAPVHESPSSATDHPLVPPPLSMRSRVADDQHPPLVTRPDTPPDQAPPSGTAGPVSESSTSETVLPHSAPAEHPRGRVPTALWGHPDPSIRPANPQQSDANLSERPRPVIWDDNLGQGLREEFRRPRKARRLSHGD